MECLALLTLDHEVPCSNMMLYCTVFYYHPPIVSMWHENNVEREVKHQLIIWALKKLSWKDVEINGYTSNEYTINILINILFLMQLTLMGWYIVKPELCIITLREITLIWNYKYPSSMGLLFIKTSHLQHFRRQLLLHLPLNAFEILQIFLWCEGMHLSLDF